VLALRFGSRRTQQKLLNFFTVPVFCCSGFSVLITETLDVAKEDKKEPANF